MARKPRKVYVATLRTVYANYVRQCFYKNKFWGLSFEEFAKLTSSPCHYCGRRNSNCYKGRTYNGIDRKENKKGYHTSNVVPCCSRCNSVKGEHVTYKEMLKIGKILKQRAKV